jgi:DNA-binding transcriptional LysR family regulator
MPLKSLKYFLAVAEELNVHKAAQKLYITQQSLSAQIKSLEEHYGAQFFERRPRLMLTPAGRSMKEFAQKVVRAEDLFIADLADITRSSTGNLRIGVTGTRGAVFLPLIWPLYYKAYPNIVVSVKEASTAELDVLLQGGKINLYIGVNVARHKNTQVIRLGEEKVYCVYSRRFLDACSPLQRQILLNNRESFDLTQIGDLPLITFTPDNGVRRMLDAFFEKMDIHPHIIFETSRHDLVFNLCKSGSGIGFVYDMILYSELNSTQSLNELCIVPVKNRQLPVKQTELTYRRESFRPQYLNGFIKITQDVFREYSRRTGRSGKDAAV